VHTQKWRKEGTKELSEEGTDRIVGKQGTGDLGKEDTDTEAEKGRCLQRKSRGRYG
jgi:hypothetical protein